MTAKPKSFYVTGLLYPAALGAALAWLVPALPAAVDSHGDGPTWWSLLFGIWFLVYHSAWFVHLVRTADDGEIIYGGRHFSSDLSDVVAVLVAFWGLGLASAQYSHSYPRLVYGAALLVPISPWVHRGFPKRFWTWWFAGVFPVGLPIAGLILPRQTQTTQTVVDHLLLVGLYVLLGLYFIFPDLFESDRSELKKPPTDPVAPAVIAG